MRFSTLIAALAASSYVSASPLLQARQSSDNDDDAVLSSPANNTVVQAGSNFQLTYLVGDDDDDVQFVDVALVRFVTVGVRLPTTVVNGRRGISTSIPIPANLTAGQWAIAIHERDDDNDRLPTPDEWDLEFDTTTTNTDDDQPVYLQVTAA